MFILEGMLQPDSLLSLLSKHSLTCTVRGTDEDTHRRTQAGLNQQQQILQLPQVRVQQQTRRLCIFFFWQLRTCVYTPCLC